MVKRILAAVFTVLLLSIGLTTSAAAATGGTERHFRATATGQIHYDMTNPLGCPASGFPDTPPFTSTLAAAGQATHLGAFTLSATHCESLGQCSDGLMTLTAANGDELNGTYVTAWAVVDGQVIVDGDLVVAGGTGRSPTPPGRCTSTT